MFDPHAKPIHLSWGPSPWAMVNRSVLLGGKKFSFLDFGKTKGLAGLVQVVNELNETLLILDFQCYAQFLENGMCLLWWETVAELTKVYRLEFRCFSVASLIPIPNSEVYAADMRERKAKISSLPSSVDFSLVAFQDEGTHQIESPSEFRAFEETLALSSYRLGENGFSAMFRALFVFDWMNRIVSVHPQDWFNHGSYDFGYQWLARVARLSDGRVRGEGVRLGTFELDDNLKQIRHWGVENPFHLLG